MRKALLIVALAALVGCQAETPTGGAPTDLVPPDLMPHCPDGTVVMGMAGPICAKPTSDAGKACTKASDCAGACLAETMTCSTMTPMFGCYEVVMEDGQKVGLCVD